ncbi:hypothetical protein CPC08DRAFT_487594 [Agrocybe pediades]|nr:hypothetical protein CPC08DRAFT_487594 [Agrocybe pediades]
MPKVQDNALDPSDSRSSLSSQHEVQQGKRRRLHGACDACRQKKSNSAERPDNLCSNCEAVGIPCTHIVPHGPKKAERQQAYISGLENRIRRMEQYFQHMYPNQDIDLVIDHTLSRAPVQSQASTSQGSSGVSFNTDLKYPTLQSPPSTKNSDGSSPLSVDVDDSEDSEAEDLAHVSLAEHFSKLELEAIDNRYFGQASAYMFGRNVSTLRITTSGDLPKPTEFRRRIYWDYQPWERAFITSPEPTYVFPEDDLLRSLCRLYFDKVNSLFPILHKPTFKKMLCSKQHHWDMGFGMTVLLVCALGSRYSDDPRVTVPDDTTCLSAGWKYFVQVPVHRKRIFYETTIYDLQYYALATLYLVGTSIPHAAWNIIGLGLRCAIERGIHRRQPPHKKPTAEYELWKRSFWCLICFDRMTSAFVGRPCSISDEDFDVDYPIECDDEYWETGDPDRDFKQPPGKPSTMASFLCLIKLYEIVNYALRTLYSTKKSKMLSGLNKVTDEWESGIVSELDSSMNKWKDNIPYILRWDQQSSDSTFFHQSVALYATYYDAQIQIHRPFLIKKSPLSFPSLAICTNAARSCTHVMEAALARGLHVIPNLTMAIYSAGLVITLNLWGSQRSGMTANVTQDLKDLQGCLIILGEIEKRWHVAGRLRDMLAIASAFHEQEPAQNPTHNDVPSQLQTDVPIPNLPTHHDTSNANVGSNWDFSNLFTLPDASFMPEIPMSGPPQDMYSILGMESAGKDMQGFPVFVPTSEDMFALWSDIPTAFSNEEWAEYLANMPNQTTII